ncbi:hypothetical protein ABUS04_06360 [Acinetobacter baumannii]|uniref:hypothetical protein n=1 Tax=Acinetobacter baumannii TaxID=470 RepID=UPI000E737DBB|nr:hypothetical protein [Acinetobacter baumannii]RJN67620.1 hypothetical protein D3X67_14860 [Acinetobacter baumannii]
MIINNLIKVKSVNDKSTGYFFQSYDEEKSFVIATKHGICNLKNSCQPYKDKTVNCCRDFTNEFDISNLELSTKEQKLKVKKVYYENNKDIVLIEVSENSQNKLNINVKVKSEKYYALGFMKDEDEVSRIILDCPQELESKIHYNIYSDPTPDLEEKSESYYGISGSIIFTNHDENPVAKGLIIENGKQNDLIAENLSDLNFEKLNAFFECKVFDKSLFEVKLKVNLNEHFEVILKKKISNELELILYSPKRKGFPHYDLSDICNAIAYEFYQIFMPKGGNINFLPSQAAFLIYKHNKLDPINKLLSARVAESYLNAPHLYSTSLNDSLYHHAHYLFINDGSDLAISIYCGHNLLETNIRMNIEKIILNANSYQFDQNLLMERSFLDQNLDQEVCDKIFDLLFSYQGRISNFCLVFTVSMELFHESEFEDVKDYIENLIENSCNNIDSTILKKLKSGLNLHVIVIPINVENEITEKFLKDLTGES